MQLHVVSAGRGQQPGVAPHYATLPRQGSTGGTPPKFSYPVDKMERGVPEGEAASVQQSDCSNNIISTSAVCQDGQENNNNNNNPSAVPGTVYYAMNV